jgi:hypothetical protein
MKTASTLTAFILGLFLFLGLVSLGYQLGSAAIDFKQLERSVTVKGLAEQEVMADIVIWPIQFIIADNDLQSLYKSIDEGTGKIKAFLNENGIEATDITFAAPAITDKSAQQWGSDNRAEFRYTATQTVTVYSKKVDQVRSVMNELSALGKQGIALVGNSYDSQTEYIYTQLNDIKPQMIEEATRNAREAATKFAEDSQSVLGKIRQASQGQFSINPRDKNNPHIMKVRVVSTVEYYLSD